MHQSNPNFQILQMNHKTQNLIPFFVTSYCQTISKFQIQKNTKILTIFHARALPSFRTPLNYKLAGLLYLFCRHFSSNTLFYSSPISLNNKNQLKKHTLSPPLRVYLPNFRYAEPRRRRREEGEIERSEPEIPLPCIELGFFFINNWSLWIPK